MNKISILSKEIKNLLFKLYEELLKTRDEQTAQSEVWKLYIQFSSESNKVDSAYFLLSEHMEYLRLTYKKESDENTKYNLYKKIEELENILESLKEVK
jgi:molecular chaperone GrpE (heat shock protein)